MKDPHTLFRFSVTIATADLAVVYCLRGLAEYCQKQINPSIAWGNTKDDDWLQGGKRVTFHFSSEQFRLDFLTQATRLLPQGSWDPCGQRDDDPARPAKK